MRVDVYECDNYVHKFAVEVGETIECCPYCGTKGAEYLYTSEIIDPKETK